MESPETTRSALRPIVARLAGKARAVGRADVPGLSLPVHRMMARIDYRECHGHWPRLREPRSYSEKLLRKMLRDRRRLLALTADKYLVREYVTALAGAQYLPDLYAIIRAADELGQLQLPTRFVMKPTHGSGRVRIIGPRSQVATSSLIAEADSWLDERYAPLGLSSWYEQIPSGVIVEEFLGDDDGTPPEDYKLFVFNQRVQMVQVHLDRSGEHRRVCYSPHWEHLDVSMGYPATPDVVPRPDRLEEMISLAERLAVHTDFVRVDLYHLAERVVFGELTHGPGGGRLRVRPTSFDRWLGGLWSQPNDYDRLPDPPPAAWSDLTS